MPRGGGTCLVVPGTLCILLRCGYGTAWHCCHCACSACLEVLPLRWWHMPGNATPVVVLERRGFLSVPCRDASLRLTRVLAGAA
ncbi:hypothetical protein NDU88_007295 [Pleurodeles waltl]|uniref:Secreted protein n=1 Tax=Pleurodeles waltl TaxID=8319 RepID=A0AAV7MJU6_PLEWA|nr:hypothetical protein NDU88_007295 [Pleurodeles waltl]